MVTLQELQISVAQLREPVDRTTTTCTAQIQVFVETCQKT